MIAYLVALYQGNGGGFALLAALFLVTLLAGADAMLNEDHHPTTGDDDADSPREN